MSYRKREPSTAILLDEQGVTPRGPGRLPRPDTPSEGAERLARTLFASLGPSPTLPVEHLRMAA